MSDVFWTVKRFLSDYLSWHAIRDGVENLVIWFPMIWKDRDFDQAYMLSILEFKLKRMEKFFRSEYTMCVNATKRANEIKIAKDLIHRIYEDEYHNNAFVNHDKKWGQIEMWTTPDENGRKDLVTCNLNRTKVCNTDDYEQERKESSILYKHADHMKKQDAKYVFGFIAKKMWDWWD